MSCSSRCSSRYSLGSCDVGSGCHARFIHQSLLSSFLLIVVLSYVSWNGYHHHDHLSSSLQQQQQQQEQYRFIVAADAFVFMNVRTSRRPWSFQEKQQHLASSSSSRQQRRTVVDQVDGGRSVLLGVGGWNQQQQKQHCRRKQQQHRRPQQTRTQGAIMRMMMQQPTRDGGDDGKQVIPDKNSSHWFSQPSMKKWMVTMMFGLSIAVCCLTTTTTLDGAAFAASSSSAGGYGSLSDEQKVVAEAWRLIDNSYIDRTFNGQDWFALREQYVRKTKYKNMDEARNAISSMTNTLGDKYTRYLSPAKYQSIVDSATGTLAGVGVELTFEDNNSNNSNKNGPVRVMVSDVEDNSPAMIAGIQPNDIFVEVDGTNFIPANENDSVTPDDVALKLRGPKGSKVGVVMERNGKLYDYILTREPITITAVRSYLANDTTNSGIGGKVGVIRIKSFSGTTSSIVSKQYDDLKKKGAAAYIMDLRSNPGGLLPGGVDTASLFLDRNEDIVFVANKNGIIDTQSTYTDGIDITSPIVILVNKNTASAAEVFTAALQENNRAIVIGDTDPTTFGKGIVQTIRPLTDNNGGLSITIAKYETPKHNNINKRGIPADYISKTTCSKDDAMSCLSSVSSVSSNNNNNKKIFQKPQLQSSSDS